MSKHTTGEMAKLCNVSVRTVQFYDTKGLLIPSDLSEGGRRLYTDDDLTKLRIICTLKAIGLSLDSIKSVVESELSDKILTLLLDEHDKLLFAEIDERQKQLEMIAVIREGILSKAETPANIILDIEHVMKTKNKSRNTRKLALVYIGVAVAVAVQIALITWLAKAQLWWGLGLFAVWFISGIAISAYNIKDSVFICPNCDTVFKVRRVFFTTGSHKVRWAKCPECGEKNWCVLRKQSQITEVENNG